MPRSARGPCPRARLRGASGFPESHPDGGPGRAELTQGSWGPGTPARSHRLFLRGPRVPAGRNRGHRHAFSLNARPVLRPLQAGALVPVPAGALLQPFLCTRVSGDGFSRDETGFTRVRCEAGKCVARGQLLPHTVSR